MKKPLMVAVEDEAPNVYVDSRIFNQDQTAKAEEIGRYQKLAETLKEQGNVIAAAHAFVLADTEANCELSSPEEKIEQAYWEFLGKQQGQAPLSERDSFKWTMRALLSPAAESRDECAPIDVALSMAEAQHEAEEVGYSGDLDSHFEAAELVEDVVDQLEPIETLQGSHGGLSAPVAEALTLAVENLLKTAKVKLPAMAFEEQVTSRARKHNAHAALEGFKDTLKQIWERLIELLKKWRDWIVNLFNMQKVKNDRQEEQAKELFKQLREKQIGKPSAAKKTDAPAELSAEFVSPSLCHILNVGGQMLHGFDMINKVHEHDKLVSDLEHAAFLLDKQVLRELQMAAGAVNIEGDRFQANYEEVMGSIMASFIGDRSNATHRFSNGIVLYERALVFGQQSYYRTGAQSVAEITDKDIVSHVKASNGSKNTDADKPIQKLSIDEAIVLANLTEKHTKVVNDRLNRWLSNEQEFKKIETAAKSWLKQNKTSDQQRASRRATNLIKALTYYTKMRNGVIKDLFSYDSTIYNALLVYAGKTKD